MGLFRKKKVAVLVDGPNLLRKEFYLDLNVVRKEAKTLGDVDVMRVYFDRYATPEIKRVTKSLGYSAVNVEGSVKVALSIDGVELSKRDDIKVVVIATRNTSYLPLIHSIKLNGKEAWVFGSEPGFSVALQRAANGVFHYDPAFGTTQEELARREAFLVSAFFTMMVDILAIFLLFI